MERDAEYNDPVITFFRIESDAWREISIPIVFGKALVPDRGKCTRTTRRSSDGTETAAALPSAVRCRLQQEGIGCCG